jgi:hypothetical protein
MREIYRQALAGIVIAALAALMVVGMIKYPNTEPCSPQTRAASRCATPVHSPADDAPISANKDGNR